MATLTEVRPEAGSPQDDPGAGGGARRSAVPRWAWVVGVLAVWVVGSFLFNGRATLYLPAQASTDVHEFFTQLKRDLIAGRDDNPVMLATGLLSDGFNAVVGFLQELVSVPAFPRPVPQVGWLGVIGLASWVSLAVAGWKHALGTVAALASIGLLGYWNQAMDTLIITFFSVVICLLIGLPIAVLMGVWRPANAVVTPVLDVLQTFPSFVYLAPAALFFSIGAPVAVAVTVLYALPPVIRVAAHGIRGVSPTTLEATASLGQTRGQRLRKVQLPMARRTIIVGVNLTTMAALSMSVIAGFVDGPGLGDPVADALEAGVNQVGVGFTAGLGIVIIAILVDRVTTAAGERTEVASRSGASPRHRRLLLAVTGLGALLCVYLSRTYLGLAEFPDTAVGRSIADGAQGLSEWSTANLGGVTSAVSDTTTSLLINPLQDLVAGSPWMLTGAALLALSFLIGGVRALVSTAVCLTGIWFTDLWYNAMVTLTVVVVATLFVMVWALVLGVWMARRHRVDRVLRPFMDAAQVMPAFVYLIPVLGLFGPGRFTAIVAAVVYGVPVAVKLVADGVGQVSPTSVEAARASGSTAWQTITKVQLPMARGHLVLAASQGLLYVLSVVVIGGLVGGGALGYDVYLGFSRSEFFGKGLVAGVAIVLLGVMIDRVARRAADRAAVH